MSTEDSEPSRNLVLVHSDGWQDVGDFLKIKAIVDESAPDIETLVASNDIRSSLHPKEGGGASDARLLAHSTAGVQARSRQDLSGAADVQADRDASAGRCWASGAKVRGNPPGDCPVCRGLRPYVVVKPSDALASFGSGIELRRTQDVRYRAPDEYPEGHPGRKAPMVAQKFINCGKAMTCRVLTLFGATIFTYCRESTRELALDPAKEVYETADYMPSAPHCHVSMRRDPDMLALAAEAYRAMPEAALQACDILRDADGRLHILEINPGGGTWMLSSSAGKRLSPGAGGRGPRGRIRRVSGLRARVDRANARRGPLTRLSFGDATKNGGAKAPPLKSFLRAIGEKGPLRQNFQFRPTLPTQSVSFTLLDIIVVVDNHSHSSGTEAERCHTPLPRLR